MMSIFDLLRYGREKLLLHMALHDFSLSGMRWLVVCNKLCYVTEYGGFGVLAGEIRERLTADFGGMKMDSKVLWIQVISATSLVLKE
ncbi:MAG: hypothetical protein PVJ60_10195 [Phycisphaerales bacterium]|jgi:hypothetical protein